MENQQIHKGNAIDAETSRAITGVRFALIVLVVFIHNVVTEVNFADRVVNVEVPFAVDIIRTLISSVFACVAVPVFFFISSYILFTKDEPYPVVLKKKFRSILVPYLIWNALITLIYFVAQSVPALKQYFATIIIRDLDAKGFVQLFIGREGEYDLYTPIVYQFWFLRDLFLCIILSPVIKKAVYKLPLVAVIAIFVLKYFSFPYGGLSSVIFYFTLGCLAVRYNLSYKSLEKIKFSLLGIFYALVVIFNLYLHAAEKDSFWWLNIITIISGGIFLLKLSGRICKNEKAFNVLKYLAGFSFWLYATHDPLLLTPIKKLWTKFLPINGFWLFIEYFGAVFLCVAVSLAIGIVVKHLLPKVFSVLTGGRS